MKAVPRPISVNGNPLGSRQLNREWTRINTNDYLLFAFIRSRSAIALLD